MLAFAVTAAVLSMAGAAQGGEAPAPVPADAYGVATQISSWGRGRRRVRARRVPTG